MTDKGGLLALLKGGGHVAQEVPYGPFCLGSDCGTYAARKTRAFRRDGLFERRGNHGGSKRRAWVIATGEGARNAN